MEIKEGAKAIIRLADGTEPARTPLTHVCVENTQEARKIFSELFAPYGLDTMQDTMTMPLRFTISPVRIDRTAEGLLFLNAVSYDAATDDYDDDNEDDDKCLEFAEWIEIHSWYILQNWNFGAGEALIFKEFLNNPCVSVFAMHDDRGNIELQVC